MNEFKIKQGLDANLPEVKDVNTLYRTTDTHRTFVGETEVQNRIIDDYSASTLHGEDLLIDSGDTVTEAFGKVETAILNNEDVCATAFVKLQDSIGLDEHLAFSAADATYISACTSVSEALETLDEVLANGEGSAKVNLNGEETTDAKFYAPIESGTSGYTLVADENGIPTWVSGSSASVVLNGERTTDAKFYAPIESGTSGYTLVADENGIPTWVSGSSASVVLNGERTAEADFYAPIESGTTAQTIVGSEGDAPVWKDWSAIQPLYDVIHPVGEVVFGFNAPAVPNGITATWEDISSSYDGRALWISSADGAMAELDGSLPTPSIVSNGAHTHTTDSQGAHTHSRGTMDISGTTRETLGKAATSAGAFKGSGTYGSYSLSTGDWNVGTAQFTFKASNGWTGVTSSAGAHTHTAQSAGAHTHSVNTTGVYGAAAGASVVRPTAVVIKVFKRTS